MSIPVDFHVTKNLQRQEAVRKYRGKYMNNLKVSSSMIQQAVVGEILVTQAMMLPTLPPALTPRVLMLSEDPLIPISMVLV